jgi:tetratricopeptide (TPR) repeat protein
MIAVIDSKNILVRVFLVLAIILALIFAWFAVRFQIGNMLAELTEPIDPNAKSVAIMATDLAPSDPLSNWLLANQTKDNSAFKLYENVIQLSPNDYRWWIELARTREQSNDLKASEAAFQQAIKLAPNYSYPYWQLGSFYLRQERNDEAFQSFKKATDGNSVFREQIFNTAWQVFEKDTAKLESIVSEKIDARVALAVFYAKKDKPEDCLRIWKTLTDEQKTENQATAKAIFQALFDKRRFFIANEFAREIGIEAEAKPETFLNGGFENPIADIKETYFGWRIDRQDKLDVKLDSNQKHSDRRSLRLYFSGYSEPQLYNVSQFVAVRPNTKYRLSFWVKTENLKSLGTPVLEIINGNDDKMIYSSKPFATGTNDWQEVKLEFITPENCEAIIIRTGRQICPNPCPIIGTVWYDDFVLAK